jgi:hypothetical protein
MLTFLSPRSTWPKVPATMVMLGIGRDPGPLQPVFAAEKGERSRVDGRAAAVGRVRPVAANSWNVQAAPKSSIFEQGAIVFDLQYSN